MASVFIYHGIGGNSKENWFPWLKAELEKAGHRGIVPDFPNTDNPNLDEWRKHMEKYEDSIDDQTIFVGHSLGGLFALRILEQRNTPIRATFLVSSVTCPEDGLEYAPRMTSFTMQTLDYETIIKNSGTFHLLHADNDPYIRIEHAQTLGKNLDASVEVILGGGHLGTNAGYTEFPLLLDSILGSL